MILYLTEWGGILFFISSISLSSSSICFKRLLLSSSKPIFQKSFPSSWRPELLKPYFAELAMIFFECLSAILDDYSATKVHLGIPVPFFESTARLPLALILGFITSSKNRRASSLSLSIRTASRRSSFALFSDQDFLLRSRMTSAAVLAAIPQTSGHPFLL